MPPHRYPPPLRDRAPLQHALPAAPDAEATGAQAAAPTQRQRLAAALRDCANIIMFVAPTPRSDTARQRGLGPHVNSCPLISAGQRGAHHSMAPAAWQALCWGLSQTGRQRYSRVSCLPSLWISGPACQPQPCHAHVFSISHVMLTCPVSQAVWQWFAIFFFFWVEESLHFHRCQSYQQSERQIKQITGEFRVHSTFDDKGSCFAMA